MLPTLAELHHDLTSAKHVDQFNMLLNQNPHETWLKRHKYIDKGNHKYLPIDKVEYLLTRIFGGYSVEVRNVQQIFNSVVVTIRLKVTHPVTGKEIFQDGVGAAPMQTDEGAKASDMSAIKNSAVQIGVPAAESYAIKDAAEKFGAIFGKDLNKRDILAFEGAYAKEEEAPAPAPVNNGQSTTTINTPF